MKASTPITSFPRRKSAVRQVRADESCAAGDEIAGHLSGTTAPESEKLEPATGRNSQS